MTNYVSAYRKMIGMTQKEMAHELNISEGTYRNKEKGRASFKDTEMKVFYDLIIKVKPEICMEEIFFINNQTKTDVFGGAKHVTRKNRA